MRTLTIEARNRESANGFYAAVTEFHPEMIETMDGEYAVEVTFYKDADVLDVLKALGDYVSRRAPTLRPSLL